jgi:streptogrisin C
MSIRRLRSRNRVFERYSLALAPCDGRPAEQFTCNASFDLVSLAANRCVDMPDANPADAAPAQICDCTGAGDQRGHY